MVSRAALSDTASPRRHLASCHMIIHLVSRRCIEDMMRVRVCGDYSRDGVWTKVALTGHQLVVLIAVRVVLAVRAHEAEPVVHRALSKKSDTVSCVRNAKTWACILS